MQESYCQIILPFSKEPEFLEKYVNASGGIRTGKLMEHLDSLAGSIAYKHVLGPSVEKLGAVSEAGFYIVTASIDRLDMVSPLTPANVTDIRLSGQVISVGSSSMEIAVKMEGIHSEDTSDQTLLIGRFSMVCRDAKTHKARKINPLVFEDDNDKALASIGEAQKHRRTADRLNALSRTPPSAAESALVHELFVKHRIPNPAVLDSGTVDPTNIIQEIPIGDTALENTSMTHPQERNVHQKVFGGYLMRLAYEIGYSAAILFTGRTMRFLSLDSTTFKLPVPVGSILRLTSAVVHTIPGEGSGYGTLVSVRVRADVIDVATGEEKNTNEFHFTWGAEGSEPLKKTVVPVTYSEAMHWLEARRELVLGAAIRAQLRRRE
ncbi:Thioesterase/thiol ester dehydrase-isomerase [Clavulina sp. PMI_390]|nr:Thioesterase/thiol ester dehydrase-isomerase [Clavulina sp. PMI_390]